MSGFTRKLALLLLISAVWHALSLISSIMQLVIWWVLWVSAQAIGNAVFRMASSAHTLQELLTLTNVEIVSSALCVPLYLLARYIVRRVWRDQAQSHALMTA
jgi:hypothetical protein